MLRLDNELRPYAWGSTTAIAELLGRVPSGGPEAELWIGAHPDSPSRVSGGRGLNEVIAEDPDQFLGAGSVAAFGPRLPYLMKVLAAAEPLSLQVHPSLEQAREGFARENTAGVPRDAASRNYKDDNHKPEMILALTPFRALCGFRPVEQSAALFEALASGSTHDDARHYAAGIAAALHGAEPLRTAFAALLAGGEGLAAVTSGLRAVVDGLTADDPHRTALEAAAGLQDKYPGDPGVLVSLLLNLVELTPGDAIHLPAGNVHAYLEGLGIEVMANSDNVLRGGLTPKHIDVPELLATVDFTPLPEVPRTPRQETLLGQEIFTPPFREFALQRIELRDAAEHLAIRQDGGTVLLVVRGALRLDSPQGELILQRGESAFIPASEDPVTAHPAVTGATDDDGDVLAFAVSTGLGIS
ncbi:mannose-6-phosphate isomerase, class I [Arthrobacter sp. Y-9]|uniref:mannose-6-phosphate isomerase, class I n=1 Tax=Arthrobacter sp. Y-9 TaxID=3039385 RepID=UPI00241EE0EB|nr:mannose-6-phosphate isomerase, class I [Arthrobacter sp. Y-9]WFR84861.1 mannose-6-phosphate isomerase, class I [Arthrobacter sp. Y-9]